MTWCKHCGKDQPTGYDDSGNLCCVRCGLVISQENFSSEVTFLKTSTGQSRIAGGFVKSVRDSDSSESHERTLAKGRNEINDIVVGLSMSGGDSLIDQSHRFYIIAVEKNFTRGRRTNQVAAACIYIICRLEKKAYLLIDFAEYLQINVYVLGAVFLQLCQILRLTQHAIVQKPIDPSLFMDRYAYSLVSKMKRKEFNVTYRELSVTSVRIIASMKRDWIQTGRKPNGLCGAALYISALSYGIPCTKSDVVNVVHVCDATLTKRLIEFEKTESGSMTIEDFIQKAKEYEADAAKQASIVRVATEKTSEVLCEHKDKKGVTNFLHGLCKSCYDDFVKISGGIQGGSDPPAFQRAERGRMVMAALDEGTDDLGIRAVCSGSDTLPKDGKEASEQIGSTISENVRMMSDDFDGTNHVHDTEYLMTHIQNVDREKVCENTDDCLSKMKISSSQAEGSSCHQSSHDEDIGNVEDDESDTFSDIDDSEVDGYLHDEEEKRLKTIIWNEMNKEYLEEQAGKEAAAAAAKASYEANLSKCADMPEAYEVAVAAAAAVEKLKKERKQKRAEEAKNNTPAQSAAEATHRMLTKKRLSSKINYDVLEKLFSDTNEDVDRLNKDVNDGSKGDGKKQRIESEVKDSSEPLYDADANDQGFQSDVFDGDTGADDGDEYGNAYNPYSYKEQNHRNAYEDEYDYDDY